jgi:hypothetical protein
MSLAGALTVTGGNNVVVLGANMSITGFQTLIANNTTGITTLTNNGKKWPGSMQLATTAGASGHSFADNWTISGSFVAADPGPLMLGNKMFISGGISTQAGAARLTAVGSTTELVMVGTGTIGGGPLTIQGNPVTINTTGTITMSPSSATTFNNGVIFTYITGSVITTGNTTTFGTSTINSGNIIWNNIAISSNATASLSSSLNVGGTLTLNAAGASTVQAFTGSAGFTTFNLIDIHTATNILKNVVFQANNTYTVTNAFNASGSAKTNVITYASSDGTARANLVLQPGASCNSNISFTRINASAGRPVYTFNGVITDCLNISQLNTLTTVGG